MNKKSITFGDIEIAKRKFYHHKNVILIDDVDINKLVILNKASSSEKKL